MKFRPLIFIFSVATLMLGACSGPPVVINRAVAAKKVDTTEIKKAQQVTRLSIKASQASAEAAGAAVVAAEATLPPFSPEAVSVPMAAVTLTPEQVISIHLDFTKAKAAIKELRDSLTAAEASNTQIEIIRAQQQERADNLAAQDQIKTLAINEAKGELAKSEKKAAEAGGALSTWRKLAIATWLLGAIYLFLRLSPWTRAFIP